MSSGWTLDQILDLPFEQILICVECVMAYKAEQLDLAMEIASAALGGKKKGKARTTRPTLAKDKASKEAAMLRGISVLGMPIQDVQPGLNGKD